MDWYDEIRVERIKQDEKWGEQNHDDLKWLAILMKEAGSVAKIVNELNPALPVDYYPASLLINRHKEIAQVAAVCIAWLEALERRERSI